MLSTNHLEPEDSETTPLIVVSNSRRALLTRRKKLKRLARILGRIFNPLNDAAVGGIILYIIAIFLMR